LNGRLRLFSFRESGGERVAGHIDLEERRGKLGARKRRPSSQTRWRKKGLPGIIIGGRDQEVPSETRQGRKKDAEKRCQSKAENRRSYSPKEMTALPSVKGN